MSWLSYGKLRAAYGATGTEPSPYLLQSTFQAVTFGDGGWGPSVSAGQNGQGGLALASRQGASQLKPERVKEFETGADFGLFRDRADASVTYYRAISSDVIFDFPVPGSTGFLVQAKNAGSIRNTGWEATLNLRPVNQRDFGWEVGFQWARNRGVVTKLAGVAYVSFTGSFNDPLGVAIEGQPASVLYGSDFIRCGNGVLINGVDIDATSCSGHPKGAMYLGSDGVPVKDLTFRVLGDPNPDWTGNVHTSFRFRKLQIAGLLDVRHGGVIWNGTRAALNHFGKTRETEALRGTQVTFGTDYLPGSVAGPGVGTKVTLDDAWWTGAGGVFNGPQSEFLESASFVKLREVSVGYTLDAPWVSQKLGFTSIELRVSGRNLKTWTNYTGIDPETSLVGGAGALRGIDYFNNPQTRSYVFTVVFNR